MEHTKDATQTKGFAPVLRLTLVRHGQTTCSQADVYCGRHCDPSLTAAGRAMADNLASQLKHTAWAALYTSPQVRAQQSLMPLSEAAGLAPILVPGLAELDYGDWDGATQASLMARVPGDFEAWRKTPKTLAPPGGETVQMLWHRAHRALMRIVAVHAQPFCPLPAPVAAVAGACPQVLVMAHKSTLRVALCGLLGLDLNTFRTAFAWPLGAMRQIEISASHVRLVGPNDVNDSPIVRAPMAPRRP